MMPKREKTQRSGFVLVVVLCMVIMLAVMLLGFNARCRMSLRAADDFRKSGQALNCARAGLNIAIAAVSGDDDIHADKVLFKLISQENTFTVGDGQCSITIVEESGKLNVNLLKDKSGSLNRTRTDQLLRLIDLLNQQHSSHSRISYGVVPSIIDWIDSDDRITCLPFVRHENAGAEASYYGRLGLPYKCRNRPLGTAEELLLIKDVTPEVFGRIRNYVTVYGDGKIDINCASKRVIESLSEKMNAALAQSIIDHRKFKPFVGIEELRDIPGITDSIYYTLRKTAGVGVTNQYYCVTSRGTLGRLGCTIVAILRKNMETKNVEVILYKEC